MAEGERSRYRVILACDGIPDDQGVQAAKDVAEEFTIGRGMKTSNADGVKGFSF